MSLLPCSLSAKVFHIPFIKATPEMKLHSILQRSPKPDDSAPADYPSLKHFTEYDEFIADSELDMVVLTTTPQTHFELTSQALRAGKHVLCEKPFVPTSAEADELVALARAEGRVLCVYQNRRWDADYVTATELVRSGKLGRVVEFETHFDRYKAATPTGWKGATKTDQGGGAVYDLGTHLIDQVYTLFGRPHSVFGKLTSQRDGRADAPEDETDGVTAQLYYDDGLVALVRVSVMSVETLQPRFWIRGTQGSYRKHCLDPQEDQLKAFNAGQPEGKSPVDAGFGVEPAEWTGRLTTFGPDGKTPVEQVHPTVSPPPTYRAFYSQLAKSLATGKEEDVPVPAAQASEVLKIIEAVRESNRTKKEVAL
jgi:predicted dehydrogenase